MFEKEKTLKKFKNKNCKISIKIYSPTETIYILYKDCSKTLRLYTDFLISDFEKDFWYKKPFQEILDLLSKDILFVSLKKRFFGRRKAYTIKKTINSYADAVKFAANSF